MFKEIGQHKAAFLVLALGLLLLITAFMAVWPDRMMQRLVAIVISVFYFLWGIITHTKVKTLNRKVVSEYLGVSFVALILLMLVTF